MILSLITMKNIPYFLERGGFKLVFNSDFSKSILIETVFQHNTMFMNLKRFFSISY